MSVTKGVYFNGKLLTLPGAYSTVESTMTASRTGSSAKVLALIGECTGGQPGALQLFSEPNVAKKVLKSGDLLKAAQKAWNPVSKTKDGVKLGGAYTIACIRTNKATKGQTKVTQSRVVPAILGEVAATVNAATTGTMIATGDYTGVQNATIKVHITAPAVEADPVNGIEAEAAKYNWCYAADGNDQLDTDASIEAGRDVLLADGISVAFDSGDYHVNDTWLIPCTAAVTKVDNVFTIQSKDWGADANSIQHKMSPGTAPGTKKMTLYNTQSDTYEVYDNLGGLFSLAYTGDQPYAVVSVVLDGDGNAIKLQTLIGADEDSAIVDLDIDLNTKQFRNVKHLINYLEGFENYKVVMNTGFNFSLTVNDIDHMEKVNIKAADVPGFKPTPITAVLPDLKKSLAAQSQMAEVSIINREVDNFDDYDFTNLLGGSEGKSPRSWVEFLDTLAGFNVTYIVPLTDDLSIIAECRDHVIHMSEDMGKERRMFCGRSNGLSVFNAIDDAQRLSSDRLQYVYPGMYDPDDNGEVQLYPAYILAAQAAGRAAFLPDGEAITHDHFRMTAIEKELEPDEITQLLNAGVVTFEFMVAEDIYESSSVRMVQDITTYTNDNDPLYVERAIGITADSLNKEIRKKLDDLLVGKRTTSATLTTAKNTVLSVLKDRVKDEIIVAYKDVNVYKENGAVWVDYAVAPSEPTNFVLIQSHFYSEDISADSSDAKTASTYGRGITDMNTVV